MFEKLNKAQVEHFLINIGIESSLEKLLKDEWYITDDKSYDEIRTPSDDEAFPYVILRNGEIFDAITEFFAKELLEMKEKIYVT